MDPKERVSQVVRRPGKLSELRSRHEKFLHRVRLKREESRKFREAVNRTPLFKQEAWARLVSSTLTALHRLLGTNPTTLPTRARKRLPKPISTQKVAYAHKMLGRTLDFLQEVAEHRVTARVMRGPDGSLQISERQALDKRREDLSHEQDVVLYPSQVFYKDDPITRLRR